MLFGILLTLGVALLSVGLRTFQNSYAQKAGALGFLAATFLVVYFITGSWVWGLAGAMGWLFLPWLEILTRIRAPASEGKTASAEKSAVCGHFPSA